MPYYSKEDIERIKAEGHRMNRVDMGWNICTQDRCKIAVFLNGWVPQTEAKKRDKHILELAFIEDMNASQIARLNDPLIVGLGNRSKGKPLSAGSILAVCYKYFPDIRKKKEYKYSTRNTRRELHHELKKQKVRPKQCSTCGSREDLELHHIIPVAVGGTNDYFNMAYLCHDCHMKLHHKLYDYLRWEKQDADVS